MIRKAITPIIGVFLLFLVAGFALAADTGHAQATDLQFGASKLLPGGQSPTLFPDDGCGDGGDRDTGDDDAPGETVKPHLEKIAPGSNSKIVAWYAMRSTWTWIFLF